MAKGGLYVNRTLQEKIDLVVEWLKKKVEEAGAKGLVVGISGGIDSALVAFLIKKAFPDDSLGVILPCKSNPKDREDALEVIKISSIKYLEIELSEMQDTLFKNVLVELDNKHLLSDKNSLKLSDANLRARLRMSTIYCIANTLNYLVVGTDNAAEVYTGYFTKYGDGGVDIIPLANLRKEEVYQWARHFGVPKSVLDKPPSAGLWEGQTDEDEMGTSYEMVDKLLQGHDIPEEDRIIIERLHNRSAHKRKMPDAPPKF